MCLEITHSIYFHCCTFPPLFFLAHALLSPSPCASFWFVMQDVSLNNFKSKSLPFSPSAPSCLFVPLSSFFLSSFFSFSLCLCVHAQQRLKGAPRTEKCGCLWTRMSESVPASLTLPLCRCLPLGCQWQSEFICCAVTGLMIDVAPANSKPIRRLM